jgi:hypothetical protein
MMSRVGVSILGVYFQELQNTFPRQTSTARDLPSSGVESSDLPAVYDALVATPLPRKSSFKNRPVFGAIRKPTPEVLQPVVEPVQQPTAP